MPAYHSKQSVEDVPEACSCSLLPLKTEVRGPAGMMAADQEDIIDETLTYFRANVLFRNFDVRGGADRTLIYLTMYTQLCLVTLEKIEDKAGAFMKLKQLSIGQFAIPGDAGWPSTLGTMFPLPNSRAEADAFRQYFKQAREELSMRLVEQVFAEGVKSKWWQSFSKRKFMNKVLTA